MLLSFGLVTEPAPVPIKFLIILSILSSSRRNLKDPVLSEECTKLRPRRGLTLALLRLWRNLGLSELFQYLICDVSCCNIHSKQEPQLPTFSSRPRDLLCCPVAHSLLPSHSDLYKTLPDQYATQTGSNNIGLT